MCAANASPRFLASAVALDESRGPSGRHRAEKFLERLKQMFMARIALCSLIRPQPVTLAAVERSGAALQRTPEQHRRRPLKKSQRGYSHRCSPGRLRSARSARHRATEPRGGGERRNPRLLWSLANRDRDLCRRHQIETPAAQLEAQMSFMRCPASSPENPRYRIAAYWVSGTEMTIR